jgi:hypothetical protein
LRRIACPDLIRRYVTRDDRARTENGAVTNRGATQDHRPNAEVTVPPDASERCGAGS